MILMDDRVEMFRKAEELVRQNGFGWEIDWCDNRSTFDEMNDREILREYAWVVFNSGMRNAVIEALWRDITKAFRYFNIDNILKDKDGVLTDALKVFGNYNKVDAVVQFAEKLAHSSLQFRTEVKGDVLTALDKLPFIGKVTKYHLARNLGFDYIKPDRHLVRLASKFGMSPFELCNLIHEKTGRRLGTIDVILWRFCEQDGQLKLKVTE